MFTIMLYLKKSFRIIKSKAIFNKMISFVHSFDLYEDGSDERYSFF